MPDPNWTNEYNTGNTPEANGFTRELNGSPVVTETTSGNPSNRKVEIVSDDGDAIFLTSTVPSLDKTTGATCEVDVQCSGPGDFGFELTFLDAAVLCMIWSDKITVDFPSGSSIPGGELIASGLDNASSEITVRLLIKPDGNFEVYRDGVLILGPAPYSDPTKAFQRVLWWGEGGGTQTVYGLRYYLGGAVAPG